MKVSLAFLILGAAFGYFSINEGSASVISCPPNGYLQQDINPKLTQLCSTVEQIIGDSSSSERYLLRDGEERNAKRQDVDHVFLRFGRSRF
ncbi:myosuppressin-like [Rhynchophorus ferrugineus]